MQSDSPTARAAEAPSESGLPSRGAVATLAKASLEGGSAGTEPRNHARKSVSERPDQAAKRVRSSVRKNAEEADATGDPSNHARESVLKNTIARPNAVGRREPTTQHVLPNAPAPKPKTRKRVAKPTLTLTPNPELVAIAKEHFANTRHGNITTWLNRALLRALRKDARRIRAAGIKIPEWLFLK